MTEPLMTEPSTIEQPVMVAPEMVPYVNRLNARSLDEVLAGSGWAVEAGGLVGEDGQAFLLSRDTRPGGVEQLEVVVEGGAGQVSIFDVSAGADELPVFEQTDLGVESEWLAWTSRAVRELDQAPPPSPHYTPPSMAELVAEPWWGVQR